MPFRYISLVNYTLISFGLITLEVKVAIVMTITLAAAHGNCGLCSWGNKMGTVSQSTCDPHHPFQHPGFNCYGGSKQSLVAIATGSSPSDLF